jgi:hypothetical protein
MADGEGRVAMGNDLEVIVAAVLARAPDWIRRDLLAKDPAVRTQAEETLAAIIANALRDVEAD